MYCYFIVIVFRLSDLEKECDDDGVVDPVQFDEEPEGAARHGQVGLGSQLPHSER